MTTDHECFTKDEALDKIAAGCKISIREGSAARNFDALYNLGVTLARSGHADEARPYLQQFLRGAPRAVYGDDLREVQKLVR